MSPSILRSLNMNFVTGCAPDADSCCTVLCSAEMFACARSSLPAAIAVHEIAQATQAQAHAIRVREICGTAASLNVNSKS